MVVVSEKQLLKRLELLIMSKNAKIKDLEKEVELLRQQLKQIKEVDKNCQV